MGKNLMTTAGSSHGLYYTASLFFKKGATVFVEDPTYFLAFIVLRNDLELNVVPVGLDSEGINMQSLEENVKKYIKFSKDANNNMFDGMLYIIPAHQNPTGLCYSEKRCKEIVKLARQYNLLVFCDDVYNLLSYSGPAIPPVFYYDNPSDPDFKGNVISNCTFSKLLGPGLRLGWFQTSENILDKFIQSGVMKSGGCPNNYTAGILASIMELGLLDETLSILLQDYKGGFFVWITLPPGVDAEKLAAFTKEKYDVSVLPGNRCSVEGNSKNCIRIAYTFHEEKIVFESVLRLCSGIKEYLSLAKVISNRV
uniref:Aminotransferase class I/classII large domain-containing protein n=1 Tax=Strigamia maritima TaxID=126957 RepID=T1IUR9_STRMM